MITSPEKSWADFRLSISPYRWLETVVITAVFPVLGWLYRPEDPFFLSGDFPWITLAPLVVAMRYGFGHAFASALSLVLAILVSWRLQLLPMEGFPTNEAIGLLLISMVAGEFSDMWTRRLRRLHVVNEYRRERLDEFTRAYHLLKISHDRLEQQVVGSPQTLRGALMQLRHNLIESGSETTDLVSLSDLITGIFSTYGWIRVAALHRVRRDRDIVSPPMATIGDAPEVDPKSPMIQKALESRQLVTISKDDESKPRELSDPLVAVPLQDVEGRLWAVFIVCEMPFIAFHEQHLRILAVLAGHMADLFAQAEAHEVGRNVEGHAFKLRAHRSWEDARQHNIPGMLVGVRCSPVASQLGIVDTILARRRGLDQDWIIQSDDGTAVILLVMPLTDMAGFQGFLHRLEGIVGEKTTQSLDEVGVRATPYAITGRKPIDRQIAELRKLCGIEEEDMG